MKQIVPVGYEELEGMMDIIYPKIEAACLDSVGKFGAEDVIGRIRRNEFQLWLARDEDKIYGLILTEIAAFPQEKVLRFICFTGVEVVGFEQFMALINDWLPLVGGIEEWGRGVGCSVSQMECHPVWERLMAGNGYEKTHIILNKRL